MDTNDYGKFSAEVVEIVLAARKATPEKYMKVTAPLREEAENGCEFCRIFLRILDRYAGMSKEKGVGMVLDGMGYILESSGNGLYNVRCKEGGYYIRRSGCDPEGMDLSDIIALVMFLQKRGEGNHG